MARVLITGVAGFIGSHLAKALLENGASVSGLDDLSSGCVENLERLPAKIAFARGSVEDSTMLQTLCRGVDYIFHQAAVASVHKSVDDPVGTSGPNLNGTLALLEAARQAGVKRLVYAASSAVYGSDYPEQAKTEDMLPAPLSPYAVQKLAGEYYLTLYSRLYRMETVALRYFNVFGPQQDPSSPYSGVLARFVHQMSLGQAPTIFGDGSVTRDFTYVDNVVNANILAAKAPSSVSGRVFNIGTGRQTTVLQAYEMIRRSTNYLGTADFLPHREGEVQHSFADISRAEKELGYQVNVDFVEGLERTIRWATSHNYRDNSPSPQVPHAPQSRLAHA